MGHYDWEMNVWEKKQKKAKEAIQKRKSNIWKTRIKFLIQNKEYLSPKQKRFVGDISGIVSGGHTGRLSKKQMDWIIALTVIVADKRRGWYGK